MEFNSDDSDFKQRSAEESSEAFTPETKKAKNKKKTSPVENISSKNIPIRKRTTSATGAEDSVEPIFSASHKAKKQKVPAHNKTQQHLSQDEMQTDLKNQLLHKASSNKTAEETYQKLTLNQHILKRPDTYIGSVVKTQNDMWVLDKNTKEMQRCKITYVPGLYKIFDEILVNAADNKQADDKENNMTYIKVIIDREKGEITVENNGKGIPALIHGKEGIYIPHMIFGQLLTGSNYDDNEKKTVGGRNGYGAKLCNVFSKEFAVEIQDSENGKRYKQTWTDNMTIAGKPKITNNKTSSFVKITFKPDFDKFNMPEGIDDDLESLLSRRVYDIAGTVRGVRVSLNGYHIKLSFKSYCEMYAKSINLQRSTEEGAPVICPVQVEDNKKHPGFEVAFAVSDGSFQQVSFVNSIATSSGGTHVNYITDQITESLLGVLNKRRKGHTLKASHVKSHIFIFINCLIDNPAFTSQTKEQMTTKISHFGRECSLTEAFLKKIAASDALKNIMDFAERKADKMMAKSDGNKRSRISNAKLVDANLAGTKRGYECTLILTEGDSAKGLAISGRAILDPDRIGVFPLRGKMLNVRDASVDQITKNQEIQNIKQFLGLKHKQTYTNTKSLRYGHLMIMADQDHDGSHIKGLLVNFLQVQFPSLLQIPGFFQQFITPVVKVWQGSDPKKPKNLKTFFNLPQYEEWKNEHANELSRWESKYLKGLGSSSNEDAQVYFTNLDQHLKEFGHMQPSEVDLLELAFSKKKADARKEWLGNFVPGTFLDHTSKSITYTDFVNRELILFSVADNIRSIPSVVDGLKPGQRKVLYASFKRNLIRDQKVIELAGYVSEKTAYHHGDVSLQQTIIGLAQTFVGSNNVNYLEPSGNFGSRLAGGSDAASPRYIHTRLSPFARKIFSSLDEPNLKHQFDDGKMIEPETFSPILPMILVNGADGIGTGWSTSIPNYNPVDIVNNIKRRMGRLEGCDDEAMFVPMQPWFRGWKGTIEAAAAHRFKCNGVMSWGGSPTSEVVVTELPIRMWTDDFKTKLEDIISGIKGPAFVKDYKEFNDHNAVHFVIQLDEKNFKNTDEENLREKLRLNKQLATSNMVAFDTQGRIRKYETVEAILEEYYASRLEMYSRRKRHWLSVYHKDYRKLRNQARFVQEIIDGVLVVAEKSKKVLIEELRSRHFEAFPNNLKDHDGDQDSDSDESDNAAVSNTHDYDYLLSMSIWALTRERVEKLNQQIEKKKEEHDTLRQQSEEDLWCKDLDIFMQEWLVQLQNDAQKQENTRRRGKRVSRKIGVGEAPKDEDEDYLPTQKHTNPLRKRAKTASQAPKPLAKGSKVTRTKIPEDEYEGVSDTDLIANSTGVMGEGKQVSASKYRPLMLTRHDQSSRAGGITPDELDQPGTTNTTKQSQTLHSDDVLADIQPNTKEISARMFIIDSDNESSDTAAATISCRLPLEAKDVTCMSGVTPSVVETKTPRSTESGDDAESQAVLRTTGTVAGGKRPVKVKVPNSSSRDSIKQNIEEVMRRSDDTLPSLSFHRPRRAATARSQPIIVDDGSEGEHASDDYEVEGSDG